MRKIIDAHCHIYPDAIAPKAVNAIDTFYGGLPSKHFEGRSEELVKVGRKTGVDHFVVFSVATSAHQVASINRFIAGEVEKYSGCMTGLGTLHLSSEDMEGDLNHLVELGLKGVKLHPDIQDFVIDDPRAMDIYAMCEERGLPIYVHTGDYRYDRSNPNRTVNVLRAFPKLKFVGPHFGGWSVWEDVAKTLTDFDNITVDTSSCFYTMKPEEAVNLIRAFGSERVMFGTDYPMWANNRDIEYIENLPITDKEKEDIFYKTCATLLDIKL